MLRHTVALFSILIIASAATGSYPVEQFEKNFEHISSAEAKINFETKKETHLIQITLDGKPAEPIPFKYSQELGRYLKVGEGETGTERPMVITFNITPDLEPIKYLVFKIGRIYFKLKKKLAI